MTFSRGWKAAAASRRVDRERLKHRGYGPQREGAPADQVGLFVPRRVDPETWPVDHPLGVERAAVDGLVPEARTVFFRCGCVGHHFSDGTFMPWVWCEACLRRS